MPDTAALEEAMRDSLITIPFVRAIAPELEKTAHGHARVRLPVKPFFASGEGEGALHPGIIAGILDQLGSEVLTAYYRERNPRATLSMALSFADDLTCHEALTCTGTCAFGEGGTGSVSLQAENEKGAILAHGQVIFMIGSYPGAQAGDDQPAPGKDDIRARFVPEEVDAKRFDDWMGIRFSEGRAELAHAVRLTGSTGPVIAFHGGMVAALALAGASHEAKRIGEGALRLSTFSLDYIRAALAEDMTATTTTTRATRRTLLLQSDLTQQDGGRHVARASVRFVEKIAT